MSRAARHIVAPRRPGDDAPHVNASARSQTCRCARACADRSQAGTPRAPPHIVRCDVTSQRPDIETVTSAMLRQRFRQLVLCAFVAIVPAGLPPEALAQLLTQHIKGAVGLKAGSQPPPGGYVPLPVVYFYKTDTVKNRNGETLPVTADLTSAFFGIGFATLRPLPSHTTGLPRLPEPPSRRAVPTTPADQAGARVDCFPAHAAFPKWQEGRHPHCHFRGLLRLHTCYGPPDRSAAQGDLCHEAPALPVTRPSRPSATRSIDNSLGGFFLHK